MLHAYFMASGGAFVTPCPFWYNIISTSLLLVATAQWRTWRQSSGLGANILLVS